MTCHGLFYLDKPFPPIVANSKVILSTNRVGSKPETSVATMTPPSRLASLNIFAIRDNIVDVFNKDYASHAMVLDEEQTRVCVHEVESARLPVCSQVSGAGSPLTSCPRSRGTGPRIAAIVLGLFSILQVNPLSGTTVGGGPVSVSDSNLARSELQDTVARLILAEAFTLSVPDSFAMEGLAASPHSVALLAWSGNTPYVLMYNRIADGPPKEIGRLTLLRPVGAAFSNSGNEAIEVIDAGRRMLSTFSMSGQHLSDMHLRVPLEKIFVAARGQEGWFLGGTDVHGTCRLHLQTLDGDAFEVSLGDLWVTSRTGCTRATLLITAFGRGVVMVSRRDEPFLSQQAGLGGSPDRLFFRPPQEPFAHSGYPARLWRALPIVALDRGYLQTFADLRSDRRLIVRYDQAGRPIRTRTIDLPIGFVTSLPAARLLIGARRITGVEIVGYVWRWNGT